MAIEDVVAEMQRSAKAMVMAVEAQRVARIGIEAMNAAMSDGPRIGVYVGIQGLLLAHAVRVLTQGCDIAVKEAFDAVITSAKSSVELGYTPWSSNGEGGA